MNTKKILRAGVSAAAAAAALTIAGTAACAQVIDFEDGEYSPFIHMKTDDGGDISELSVEEFNGSKQLKVDVQDCSLLPKVEFDLNAIVGTDNLSNIDKIEMEVTIASKDGETPPGWIGGALGTAGGDDSPGWDQSDYSGGEYENPVAETILVERKFLLPSKKPVSGTEGTIALLMRWAADVPYYMYIDNVRFLGADGNELDLMIGGGSAAPAAEEAPAETEAPAEEAPAEEAPAETEAPAEETPPPAPASDNTSSAASTGNVPAAALATIAACAAAAAVLSRKK